MSWTQKLGGVMPRPKTGETPIRHVRVDDQRWEQVEQAATEDGKTKTDIVVQAIDRYLTYRKRTKKTSDD